MHYCNCKGTTKIQLLQRVFQRMLTIANRIYEILEARGMSQKDFAKLMGKTETEVSRWLSGTHNLTMATICKISAALDAEVVKVADYELEPAYA